MRCRVLWPRSVVYFKKNWDLQPALIHATDQELFHVHSR